MSNPCKTCGNDANANEQLDRAEREIDRLRMNVHSCHSGCEKAGCVNGRLLRLLDDLRASLGDNGLRMQDDLVAFAESLRKDAERYRYARINSYIEVKCDSPRMLGVTPEDGGLALDAEIDAAIAAESAP
jgi:hypothetical protein